MTHNKEYQLGEKNYGDPITSENARNEIAELNDRMMEIVNAAMETHEGWTGQRGGANRLERVLKHEAPKIEITCYDDGTSPAIYLERCGIMPASKFLNQNAFDMVFTYLEAKHTEECFVSRKQAMEKAIENTFKALTPEIPLKPGVIPRPYETTQSPEKLTQDNLFTLIKRLLSSRKSRPTSE